MTEKFPTAEKIAMIMLIGWAQHNPDCIDFASGVDVYAHPEYCTCGLVLFANQYNLPTDMIGLAMGNNEKRIVKKR